MTFVKWNIGYWMSCGSSANKRNWDREVYYSRVLNKVHGTPWGATLAGQGRVQHMPFLGFVGECFGVKAVLLNSVKWMRFWRRQWHPLQYSCLANPMDGGAWWAAVHGVAKSQTRLSDFSFPFHFHALEKEMATHSSVLAWRIPGTGQPSGLPSMGSHRVGHDWIDLAAAAAAAVGI